MISGNISTDEVRGGEPIISSAVAPTVGTTGTPNSHRGSFILSWLARLAAVTVLIGSAYTFYRFAENDFEVKVLLWAFALCFGLGALAYGPLFIIAGLLKRSRKTPTKRQAVWVLALSLPWLMAGGILITYPNVMRFLGIAAMGFSGLFTVWSILHWQRVHRLAR